MDFVDGPVPLGEWLPDIRDLKFPNLSSARYVEPVGTVYKYFEPLGTSSGPVVPGGFIRGYGQANVSGIQYIYAGTDDGIFMSFGGGSFTARSATIGPAQYDFLQYDEFMVATTSGDKPLYHTAGSTTNFATIGAAPSAVRVGKINQFLVLGNLTANSHAIQWSAIDDPLNWPTPSSATAIAKQSGQQFLDAEFGEVTGFANGDQFGLVFQVGAITRVTYVGPPVVFQFDKVSDKIGCPYPRSIIQVGGLTYFISASGIHRTNGVTIENIGLNKVDNYFFGRHGSNAKERVYAAHNRYRNLIYWTYCDTSDPQSTPSGLLIYNHVENRFTDAGQACGGIISTNGTESFFTRNIQGFGTSNTLGRFGSTAGAFPGSFETGDIEFNPGGFARLSGAKLIVDQTSNAVVGYSMIRNELVSAQVTTGSASTTNAATGFCDFRREARYHKLLFEVSGTFNQAQALEFKAVASGSR